MPTLIELAIIEKEAKAKAEAVNAEYTASAEKKDATRATAQEALSKVAPLLAFAKEAADNYTAVLMSSEEAETAAVKAEQAYQGLTEKAAKVNAFADQATKTLFLAQDELTAENAVQVKEEALNTLQTAHAVAEKTVVLANLAFEEAYADLIAKQEAADEILKDEKVAEVALAEAVPEEVKEEDVK